MTLWGASDEEGEWMREVTPKWARTAVPQSTRPLHRGCYLVWIWAQRWFSGLYYFSICCCFICMSRIFFFLIIIIKCWIIPWSFSACCTVGCLLSTPSSPLHHLLARNSALSKNETISRTTLTEVWKTTPYLEYFWGRGEHPLACMFQLHYPVKDLALKLLWTVTSTLCAED